MGESWDVRRGASRGRQGAVLVAGRKARAGRGAVCGARDRKGSRFPRRGRCEKVPAHVAQVGTLTSRGRIRREGSVHVAQTDPPSTGKGVAGGGRAIHVAQMGTLPPEGLGEERDEGDERRYPSTLHRRVPSSYQESRERRLSPRRRLRKIGSCSSLNSQKEPIPTQFAGVGPEGRGVSPIVSAGVADVEVPSHQESRESRLSPRKRLRKTGPCNSFNSQKGLIF
jgi:hypothetical protein